MTQNTNNSSTPNALVAGLLAWLVPGAGHLYLQRRGRSIILFIAIGATFWSGMAMGGVMTVDRSYEPWWFTAQMLTGVHGLVGWYRQDRVYQSIRDDLPAVREPGNGRPGQRQMAVDAELRRRGLVLANPTAGVARAYTGIAGMLNLLCVFDAFMLGLLGLRGEPRRGQAPPEPSEGKG